jgi:hypothetical protein
MNEKGHGAPCPYHNDDAATTKIRERPGRLFGGKNGLVNLAFPWRLCALASLREALE